MPSLRTYYYFLLGAAGGLGGWYGMTLLFSGGTFDIWQNVQRGGLLGACIGVGVGAYEGIRSYNLRRFLRFAGFGLLMGLAAGAVALPLAETAYAGFGKSGQANPGLRFMAPVGCWLLLGGLLGLGGSMGRGSQAWKGVVGGLLGALVGGAIHEWSQGANAEDYFKLAGAMTLLGGCISAGVALVATILEDACIEVEKSQKKMAGHRYDISRFVHPIHGAKDSGLVGSHPSADVFVPDEKVAQTHATISFVQGAPTLTVSRDARKRRLTTLVNGRPVEECPLAPGDRVQVGETVLVFHAREMKRSWTQ